MVEHTLGKGEVTGSIPVVSSERVELYEGRGKREEGNGASPFRPLRAVRFPLSVEAMPRDKIILACNECKNRNYFTTKNKRLHPERVEWKKYCPRCNKHQVHKETK